MGRRPRRVLVATLALLVAWGGGSLLLGPDVLPSPVAVAVRLVEVVLDGGPRGRSALYHLGRSLVRVASVSLLTLALSTALGLAMGVDDRAERLVGPWLPLWTTVPTLVVVLLSMVLFDFSEWAVVVGVTFVATPFAADNVRAGTRSVDPALVEMARAFDVGRRDLVRELYLPAALPQVVGGFRYLLGMVWKVVVLAETFGLDSGLGAMFRFWFNRGDLTAVLAYLSLFVVAMVAAQYAVGVESNRLFAWRE